MKFLNMNFFLNVLPRNQYCQGGYANSVEELNLLLMSTYVLPFQSPLPIHFLL